MLLNIQQLQANLIMQGVVDLLKNVYNLVQHQNSQIIMDQILTIEKHMQCSSSKTNNMCKTASQHHNIEQFKGGRVVTKAEDIIFPYLTSNGEVTIMIHLRFVFHVAL